MEFAENSSALVEKALSGDACAWDRLVERLWPVAAAAAASLVGAPGDDARVEDIAQNVFVRLLENGAARLRRFDPARGVPERYVARIARNCAVDYLRGHARHAGNVGLSAVAEAAAEDPGAPLPMLEAWEMAAALNTLSPRERQAVDLLYKRNLDAAETATAMGVTPDTVRSLKSHALGKLKRFFGQS